MSQPEKPTTERLAEIARQVVEINRALALVPGCPFFASVNPGRPHLIMWSRSYPEMIGTAARYAGLPTTAAWCRAWLARHAQRDLTSLVSAAGMVARQAGDMPPPASREGGTGPAAQSFFDPGKRSGTFARRAAPKPAPTAAPSQPVRRLLAIELSYSPTFSRFALYEIDSEGNPQVLWGNPGRYSVQSGDARPVTAPKPLYPRQVYYVGRSRWPAFHFRVPNVGIPRLDFLAMELANHFGQPVEIYELNGWSPMRKLARPTGSHGGAR